MSDYDNIHSDRRTDVSVHTLGEAGPWTDDHKAAFYALLVKLASRLEHHAPMYYVAKDVHHRLYGHTGTVFFAVSPIDAVLTFEREVAESVAGQDEGVLYIITASHTADDRTAVVTIDHSWRNFV